MVSEEDFNYVVDNLDHMLQTCYDRCIDRLNCGCDKDYDRAVAIVKDMYSTVDRVRELHGEIAYSETTLRTICKECHTTYPCPTIKALDGEQ